jgi:hypothetical protein
MSCIETSHDEKIASSNEKVSGKRSPRDISFERVCILKHCLHCLHASCWPGWNIPIKKRNPRKHSRHRRRRRCIPPVLMFDKLGFYSIIKSTICETFQVPIGYPYFRATPDMFALFSRYSSVLVDFRSCSVCRKQCVHDALYRLDWWSVSIRSFWKVVLNTLIKPIDVLCKFKSDILDVLARLYCRLIFFTFS